MHFSAPSSIFFKVAFWWLLKSFKMVTRHKKLVAIKKKKKKETLGVILHEGNIDYWYFMFCIKLFQQHDRWAQVAKLATFAVSWVSNTYIFLLVMASKMAAAWSAVFAIFFVTVAVNFHPSSCRLSLFHLSYVAVSRPCRLL